MGVKKNSLILRRVVVAAVLFLVFVTAIWWFVILDSTDRAIFMFKFGTAPISRAASDDLVQNHANDHRVVAALDKCLENPTSWTAQRNYAATLGGIVANADDPYPALVVSLKHWRRVVRKSYFGHGRQWLQQNPDEAAILFNKALEHQDARVRKGAAQTLLTLEEHPAHKFEAKHLPILLEIFESSTYSRWNARIAIAGIGPAGGLALSQMLPDTEAMRQLYNRRATCVDPTHEFWNDDEAFSEFTQNLVASLDAGETFELYEGKEFRVADLSAIILGSFGVQVVPTLVELLDHNQSAVRSRSARILGGIGPDAVDAVPRLERLVREDSELVKVTAADALSRITPDLHPWHTVITDSLESKDPGVRIFAVRSLNRPGLAARKALPVLIELVGIEEDPLRPEYVVAIGRLLGGRGQLLEGPRIELQGVHLFEDNFGFIGLLEGKLPLDLTAISATETGIKFLADLKNTRTRGFTSSRTLTDSALKYVEQLPDLKWVNLNGAPITDVGVQYLTRQKSLESLSLSYTEVTDASLDHLTSLRQLHTLILNGTHVTDAGVKELKEALPKCSIRH